MHSNDNHEREVKFYLSDIKAVQEKFTQVGALKQKERVHEYNLRFDSETQFLRENHQVLRLRKDDQAHLTYKGPADLSHGIADRQELEITVGDFDTARQILEALGFSVFMIYEKYRTTYFLDSCEIVLDELPFGNFIEIEGESEETIRYTAKRLGLDWEKRITASYLELFSRIKTKKNLTSEHLLFINFTNIVAVESDFNLG